MTNIYIRNLSTRFNLCTKSFRAERITSGYEIFKKRPTANETLCNFRKFDQFHPNLYYQNYITSKTKITVISVNHKIDFHPISFPPSLQLSSEKQSPFPRSDRGEQITSPINGEGGLSTSDPEIIERRNSSLRRINEVVTDRVAACEMVAWPDEREREEGPLLITDNSG